MPSLVKTFFFTSFALIAFAVNSVLCRLALGEHIIDAASFTVIRLISGAVTLVLMLKLKAGVRFRDYFSTPGDFRYHDTWREIHRCSGKILPCEEIVNARTKTWLRKLQYTITARLHPGDDLRV